jgi:hypothetical protein
VRTPSTLQLTLLGSAAVGLSTMAATLLTAADAVPAPSALLDPAYVARQLCGAMHRKTEFF